MKTIPLTQGKVALVDDEDYEALAQHRWYAHRRRNTFYASRVLPGTNGAQTQMHHVVMGATFIDHKNGNGLDNQKSNLRRATNSQNSANQVNRRPNKSGRRGVTWHQRRGCQGGGWQAQIGRDGKCIYLGLFADLDDAARAYDAAALELFGEFAHLNFEKQT